jgi:hypothetical protein
MHSHAQALDGVEGLQHQAAAAAQNIITKPHLAHPAPSLLAM